jgi:hypothetical protein
MKENPPRYLGAANRQLTGSVGVRGNSFEEKALLSQRLIAMEGEEVNASWDG